MKEREGIVWTVRGKKDGNLRRESRKNLGQMVPEGSWMRGESL